MLSPAPKTEPQALQVPQGHELPLGTEDRASAPAGLQASEGQCSPQCPVAPTGEDRTPSAPPTGQSFCTLHWGPAQQVTHGHHSAKPEGGGRVDGRANRWLSGRLDGRAASGQMDGRWVDDGQMDGRWTAAPLLCKDRVVPRCWQVARDTETWTGGLGAAPAPRTPHTPPASCTPSCPGPSQLHPPSSRGTGPRLCPQTPPVPPRPRRPGLTSTRSLCLIANVTEKRVLVLGTLWEVKQLAWS